MESHCMDHSVTYIFTLYSTLENFPHLCKDQHWSLKWPYSISLCGWIIIFLTCSLMTNTYTVSWLLPLPKMLPAASSFTYLCACLHKQICSFCQVTLKLAFKNYFCQQCTCTLDSLCTFLVFAKITGEKNSFIYSTTEKYFLSTPTIRQACVLGSGKTRRAKSKMAGPFPSGDHGPDEETNIQ